MRTIVIAAAMIAAPATAQVTTNCQSNGGFTRCTTNDLSAPRQGVDYNILLNQPSTLDAINQGLRNNEEIRRREQQRKSGELRKRVGQLASSGDCEGAAKLAASEGDFELADDARKFCRAN